MFRNISGTEEFIDDLLVFTVNEELCPVSVVAKDIFLSIHNEEERVIGHSFLERQQSTVSRLSAEVQLDRTPNKALLFHLH